MNKPKREIVECSYAWRVFDVKETPDGKQKTAIREIPKPGINIYEITAGYSTRRKPSVYHFYGSNKEHARERFKNRMVLDLYSIRQLDKDIERATVQKLLSDPLKFPI